MKEKTNKIFLNWISHIKALKPKDVIYNTIGFIATFALALTIFLFTPLVSYLDIVGSKKIISVENLMDNVLSKNNKTNTNEIVLKYLIKQKTDPEVSYEKIISAIRKIDSLDNEVELWRMYAHNIIQIFSGSKEKIIHEDFIEKIRKEQNVDISQRIDSLLVVQAEYLLSKVESEVSIKSDVTLFPPMVGKICANFNFTRGVLGIKILSNGFSEVMSITEGTVVSLIRTDADAYIMQLQHRDNTITIYKGITSPLKEVGERVEAKEVIGYIGDKVYSSEEYINVLDPMSPSILSFEIWRNGNPLDPEKHIVF